ncbi:MAG: polysaccharide deacetylase family protein [Abitibacteriaceae bacterium]|nr:polysaccharide deacetylase family protein [Abditibacteriaceae bacterium]
MVIEKEITANIFCQGRWLVAASTVAFVSGCASQAHLPAQPNTLPRNSIAPLAHKSPSAKVSRLRPVDYLPPVQPQVILHLSSRKRVVALTFDACQTRKPARYDQRIIQILRQTKTPATLMLGGRWMETHPAVTRGLAANPLFELGNHSYLHPHMTKIALPQMREEIQKTQRILFHLTGKRAVLFRPPYGEYNPALVRMAGSLGLKTLMWDVETGDPDPHESAKSIIHTVLSQARPGSIVIMHVNGRGWHSAEALPTIIRSLRQRGFKFKTISEAQK